MFIFFDAEVEICVLLAPSSSAGFAQPFQGMDFDALPPGRCHLHPWKWAWSHPNLAKPHFGVWRRWFLFPRWKLRLSGGLEGTTGFLKNEVKGPFLWLKFLTLILTTLPNPWKLPLWKKQTGPIFSHWTGTQALLGMPNNSQPYSCLQKGWEKGSKKGREGSSSLTGGWWGCCLWAGFKLHVSKWNGI